MTFKASDVTREVRFTFPAFYPDAHPEALNLVQKAHSDVVRECGLYALETISVNLTAGTREYALDPDVFRVNQALYLTGPGVGFPLGETSTDELDQDYKNWRLDTPAVPNRYYEEGGNVGFYPTPSTSTASGYPVVNLIVRRRNAPTTMDSVLPPQLPTIDAYVYAVCSYWCARNDRASLPTFLPLAQASMKDLQDYVQKRLARLSVSVQTAFPVPKNR